MKTVYGPIILEPLTGTIGAEVVAGAAIGPLDDETVAHLHAAWVDWQVLFFRDQHVTTDDHIAFGRQFGELEVHPFLPNDGHPEIVVLDTHGEGPSRAERWHTDVSFREAPPTGSILRGRIIPPVGGDTLWADMEQADEQLDEATKDRIEHLTATHTLHTNFGRKLPPAELDRKLAEYPDQHHPVVRVHPVTGRRSLFVNGSFVDRIDDVDPDEGRALLARLIATASQPTYQVRFRWQPDSFAISLEVAPPTSDPRQRCGRLLPGTPCMLICMHSTSVRIDAGTHEDLKRLAAELNTTVGNTVTLAVRALRQDRIGEDLRTAVRADEAEWLDADLR